MSFLFDMGVSDASKIDNIQDTQVLEVEENADGGEDFKPEENIANKFKNDQVDNYFLCIYQIHKR